MPDTPSLDLTGLSQLRTEDWQHLARGLMQSNPELARQFKFLDTLLSRPQDETLRKATQQFIGASKCPSSAGCERLASRTRWLISILTGDAVAADSKALVLQAALEKLLPACEGADDRNALFRPAVREFVQKSLQFVGSLDWPADRKVELVFALAMVDQCTLVEPVWWWNYLVRTNEAHCLKLAGHLIEQLPMIEPATDRSWKTLGGRWARLRLKSFLEYAQARGLLADLLAKSALDDFEAAQAVKCLRETGRGREALSLAERWNRLMPASPVLAWELAELYLADGWDEEALSLIQWQYERDPHPRWLPLYEKAAGDQWDTIRESLQQISKQ